MSTIRVRSSWASSSAPTSTASSQGVRFYKSVEQHRHAYRQSVDEHRHPARPRRPSRVRPRPAGRKCFSTRRSRRGKHDVCRVVSHQRRPLFGVRRLFHQCRRRSVAASCAAERRRRWQRRVPYGPTAFPTQTFNATNYWVDVVFDSTPDTTKPVIGDVTATPVDASFAVISWSTTEHATSIVDYSTDSTFPPSQTLSVSDAAPVMSHSLRITGLHPDTRYFFRLKSIDPAGNEGTWPPAGPIRRRARAARLRCAISRCRARRCTIRRRQTSAPAPPRTPMSPKPATAKLILAPMGAAEFSGIGACRRTGRRTSGATAAPPSSTAAG